MIFGWLVSLFGGPLISSILGSVVDVYKKKIEAETSKDAKSVELAAEELRSEIKAREQAAAIVLAEQGHWTTRWIRPAFAFPLVIYVNKVILVDKVLGWGSTDPITGAVGDWAGWILAAYFISRPLEKMTYRIFKR